jgi:hypothetical protein
VEGLFDDTLEPGRRIGVAFAPEAGDGQRGLHRHGAVQVKALAQKALVGPVGQVPEKSAHGPLPGAGGKVVGYEPDHAFRAALRIARSAHAVGQDAKKTIIIQGRDREAILARPFG